MGVHDKGQIIGSNWVQSRQGTLMAMMMTRVMMMVIIAMMRMKAVMMMILMAPK